MSLGGHVADALHFLKDGGPGATLGLIVGLVLAYPNDCDPVISGPTQCHNLLGQDLLSSTGGTPLSLEWLSPICGFIILGAVAGWLVTNMIRILRSEKVG